MSNIFMQIQRDKTAIHEPVELMEQTGYYFAEARNMIANELSDADSIVLRMAYIVDRGGYIYLMKGEETGKYWVCVFHTDYEQEPIVAFRRRKRALKFIALVYLFALDRIGDPR